MSLAGSKVFVTGASGFIGASLVQALLRDQGAKLTLGVRSAKRGERFSGRDLEVRRARLDNRPELDAALRNQEVVFNLAYDFRQSAEANIRGFENLVELCVARGTRRLVHLSSIAVYDDWPEGDFDESAPSEQPGHEYKNAKMAMERLLLQRAGRGELEAVILQPTLVYGPGSRFWTDMIVEQLLSGTVILPDQAPGLCNAVYVDDVAKAMLLAAEKQPAKGERYIISAEEPVPWLEYFQAYDRLLGSKALQYVDAAALTQPSDDRAAGRGIKGRVTEALPLRQALNAVRSMLGTDFIERARSHVERLQRWRGGRVYYPDPGALAMYLRGGRCSIEKAKAELGYRPQYDFTAGFAQTAEYIKSKYP